MKMHALLLIGCFVLTTTEYFLSSAHMIPDEILSTNKVAITNALSQSLEIDSTPVVIAELPKTARSKKGKKQKKKKMSAKHPPAPPSPANCIPLWGSCKSPNSKCCDICAFCQCRLFRTVCFCRMGNPHC